MAKGTDAWVVTYTAIGLGGKGMQHQNEFQRERCSLLGCALGSTNRRSDQRRSWIESLMLRWFHRGSNTGHVLACLSLMCLAIGFPLDQASAQNTARVSVATSGIESNGASSRASVSGDGRYVAYYSDATNLVPGDNNGVRDVFVRDRQTGTTVRISVNSSGTEGDAKSDRPSISGNGRFVAFISNASNLVLGGGGVRDVYVHDRDSDNDGIFDEVGQIAVSRVSVSSTGVVSDGRSSLPVITSDGRYVVFRSRASNLAPGATFGTDQIFVHDRQAATTVLVSVSSTGAVGDADSDRPDISPDGRYIAFHSDASNLVPGDTPTFDAVLCPACTGLRDSFVHDRDPDGDGIFLPGTGTTERVSLSTAGVAGNGFSSRPKLSSDGRFVLFKSLSNNLVAGDTNAADDVFVRDRVAGTTVRVSVSTSGTETVPFGPVSGRASLSNTGRYVAFYSEADDLVAGDTNLFKDIFVRDRQAGSTVRVSVDSAGVEGNGASNRPSISSDGRFVAFYSDAFNLVAGDQPPFDAVLCPTCTGVRDIFVRDRDTNVSGIFDQPSFVSTTRVSIATGGVVANVDCTRPSISGDGRYVAFRSAADNLVASDTNGMQDIFVHDRQTSTTVRVSVSSSGVQTTDGNSDLPSISGDGRFVAFWSKASNLVLGDDPPFDSVTCPTCVGVADIFVHDRDTNTNGVFDEPGFVSTTRVSVSSAGVAGDADSDRPWMSVNGLYVGYISDATNLTAGDVNGHSDVFVHELSTGTTFMASINSAGIQGNFGSDRVTLSADGRFVGIRSKADNLVAGDDPSFDATLCPACIGVRDVFLHDRDPDVNGIFDEGNGVTSRASISTSGTPTDLEMGGPKLSGDGMVLAMVGSGTTLVAGDTNFSEDVFVRDLASATTERVNVDSAGAQASSPTLVVPDSDDPTISADGRFVAFRSFGVNLVPKDINQVADVFLHDRDVDGDGIFDEPGAIDTTRIGVAFNGAEGDLASGGPKLSANGNVIVFYSDATNLVLNDNNIVRDVFARGAMAGICGNGVVESGEACDDGGESTTCNFDCTISACGDSVVNMTAGEDCDDGGESANCDADCTFAICGDGTLNVTAGEQCDDGNTTPGGGCDPFCMIEPAVPTVSQWGVLAMTLVLLIFGTVILRMGRSNMVDTQHH